MDEVINLTEEEIKSIRAIQKEYTENVYNLGQLQVDYVEMSKSIEEISSSVKLITSSI